VVVITLIPCGASAAVTPPARRPWLSSAGERMFQEELAQGRYLTHPLARWYATPTFAAPVRLDASDRALASDGFTIDATQFGLAADARANDRIPAVSCIVPCV